MTPDLVQLKTLQFEALVPSFQDIPARLVLEIFQRFDGAKQVDALRELLRDNLPPEKVEDYDRLGIDELMEVVMQWIKPDEN